MHIYLCTEDIKVLEIPLLWHHWRIVLGFGPALFFHGDKGLFHIVESCRLFSAHGPGICHSEWVNLLSNGLSTH